MKKLCLLLSALVLNGCLHAAPSQPVAKPAPPKVQLTATLVEQTIIKGKTTKEEITAKLGIPNSVAPNTFLPPAEKLAKVKADELPPIARTLEFWHYWTTPSQKEMELAVNTGKQPEVLRLMIFIGKDGVVQDYLTETRSLDFNK